MNLQQAINKNDTDADTAQSTDIFEEMNNLGSLGIPFLFIIDFDMLFPIVMPLSDAVNASVLYDINGIQNTSFKIRPKRYFSFTKEPVDFKTYNCAFEKVVGHEKEGNSYLVNLTFPTLLDTDLTLHDIFHASVAQFKLFFRDEFVVFSPEPFVRIDNGTISTYPMKGTIDASIPDAERRLREDGKELAEHLTVVDLLRNDLNMVSRNVRVERFRFFSAINTNGKRILQTSSHISGDLDAGYSKNIGTIIRRMLPAGSVTGAPKKKTIEIIREAEIDDRGFYTGVFGWSNGAFLDSAVMIRFIEKRNGRMYARSGGGITIYSDPISEYREMIDKVYVPVA